MSTLALHFPGSFALYNNITGVYVLYGSVARSAMNAAFPRLSAWLGLGPPAPSAEEAATAPPAEDPSTAAPMEVEEEATAAAAAAWLSPELATAAAPPTPAASAAAAAPFSPSFATERPQRPRRRPSPQLMEAPALAAPTLAEEPPSQPAPVRLPETAPVEQVEKMVLEPPKPRRKPCPRPRSLRRL